MLGIYIASGVIVCLGIAIAVFNRIEKLKRTIEAKQADLEEAKAESIRKENRLLVSFTEQSADFRKKMEMAEDELHFVKDQYDEMLKDQTTLTEDRDKWKAKAEVTTAENNDLKPDAEYARAVCVGKNCRTTIVNGRVLYKDREFVAFDEVDGNLTGFSYVGEFRYSGLFDKSVLCRHNDIAFGVLVAIEHCRNSFAVGKLQEID